MFGINQYNSVKQVSFKQNINKFKVKKKGGGETRIYRRTVQKGLNNLHTHDGIVTYLEPDILECEVEWALGSITTY